MYEDDSEEPIKYIRGIPKHGKDIEKLLESMGAIDLPDHVHNLMEDPQILYFIDDNKNVCRTQDNSILGKLLLKHGKEIFLEPEFKFNVGDFVLFKRYYNKPCRIIRRYNDQGKPVYIVRDFRKQITSREWEHVLMPYEKPIEETIYHSLTPMKDSTNDEWANDFVECFNDDECCCVSIVKYGKTLLIKQRENQSLEEYIADLNKLRNELDKFISFLGEELKDN